MGVFFYFTAQGGPPPPPPPPMLHSGHIPAIRIKTEVLDYYNDCRLHMIIIFYQPMYTLLLSIH